MSASSTLVAGHDARKRAAFGGLVPSAVVVRAGSAVVAALGVELYAEGAMLPLLVLSDSAGPLTVDASEGVVVVDDRGHDYVVEECAHHPGLGSLQLDVWITPVPAPGVRYLQVSVDGLTRTAITRGGEAVSRLLSGGPWDLRVEMVPSRTTAPVPAEPPAAAGPAPSARVPARAYATFEGVVPIGQARVADDLGLCLWALERYRDRAVLSLSVLADAAKGRVPPASEAGAVELWDDSGHRYAVAPVHSAVRAGWSETILEVLPVIPPHVRSLGLRICATHGDGEAEFTFGISMPEAPTG